MRRSHILMTCGVNDRLDERVQELVNVLVSGIGDGTEMTATRLSSSSSSLYQAEYEY